MKGNVAARRCEKLRRQHSRRSHEDGNGRALWIFAPFQHRNRLYNRVPFIHEHPSILLLRVIQLACGHRGVVSRLNPESLLLASGRRGGDPVAVRAASTSVAAFDQIVDNGEPDAGEQRSGCLRCRRRLERVWRAVGEDGGMGEKLARRAHILNILISRHIRYHYSYSYRGLDHRLGREASPRNTEQ